MKIFVHSTDATGHLNSTIGVAQALVNRGHEVVFLINAPVKPRLEALGFRVLELHSVKALPVSENPAKEYSEFLKEKGFLTDLSSYEKAKLIFSDDIMALTAQPTIDFNSQLERYILEEKPDCIVMDQLFYYPCLSKTQLPWIPIMSGQPKAHFPHHENIPPVVSGYWPNEREKFAEFQELIQEQLVGGMIRWQDRVNSACSFTPKGDEYKHSCFYKESPFLNLYQYPDEMNYPEYKKYENFFSVDAFVRTEVGTFDLPSALKLQPGEKLIYLSLGSMGGADFELMQRLIKLLSQTKHKAIVSKGPLGDKIELAENMWGENVLPQTSVLPLVDLVITHGGNNTVCESFYFGKPMLVLPLFADQFDNAQRVTETGFGDSLDTYKFKDEEFFQKIETLLNDEQLAKRLDAAVKRIRADDKKIEMVKRIEEVVSKSKSR